MDVFVILLANMTKYILIFLFWENKNQNHGPLNEEKTTCIENFFCIHTYIDLLQLYLKTIPVWKWTEDIIVAASIRAWPLKCIPGH